MKARGRQCTKCGRQGPWLSDAGRFAKLHHALTALEVADGEVHKVQRESAFGPSGAGDAQAIEMAKRLREYDFERAAQGIVDILSDLEGVCFGCATGRAISAARQLEL